MSAKQTYWLSGPDGNLIQVEGAARRDELMPQGWAEVAEPGLNDRVWLQHETTEAFALFPAAALDPWQARGWHPAVPPTERGDLGYHVAVSDAGHPLSAAQPLIGPDTPAVDQPVETKPSKPAAGGDMKKE